MGYENTLTLNIEVNNAQGNAAIKDVNQNLSDIERQAAQVAKSWGVGMDKVVVSAARAGGKTRTELYEGTQAARLLGNEIGISLPRSVSKFLAQSALIGPLLSSAFEIGIVIAIGEAIFKGAEHLYKWATNTREATEAVKGLRDEIVRLTKETDAANRSFGDAMLAAQLARGKLGLSGSAATGIDIDFARRDLAFLENQKQTAEGNTRTFQNILSTAKLSQADAANWQKNIAENAVELNKVNHDIDVKNYELQTMITNKKREQVEEARKLSLEYEKQLALGQGMLDSFLPAQEARAVAGLKLAEETYQVNLKNRQEMEAFRQAAQANFEKTTGMVSHVKPQTIEEQVKAGERINQEFALGIIKAGKDETDALKKMADEAKRAFEQTANAIEGFIDRVFLTAKSFADVWKQLWMQAAHYAVSMISRALAASFMGYRQVAGAPAGGGGGAGAAGIGGGGSLANIAGGLISPASLGGLAAGGGGGGVGGLLGGGGLLGSTMHAGSGIMGLVGGLAAPVGLGAMLGGKVGGPLGAILGGLGGVGIAGGLSALGTGALTGGFLGTGIGGFLGGAAALLTNPITIAIGAAAIGIGLLYTFLHKAATEKAREKIKATYGVDIKDKGVLQQIVDMAKQSFGGNLDMCIRSTPARDLIQLYAMSTGQSIGGLPASMTPTSFVQSGGSLYQLPSYVNGVPTSLPGSGLSGGGGGITVIVPISIPGAQQFFEQETMTLVARNVRPVATAVNVAMKQNFSRRETTATQISPGTLTS